jgi:hypothetical protein
MCRAENHPIGMMNGATQRVMLVRMGRVGDPADLRSQHLQNWREASNGALRSYKAWCAASRQDRHEKQLSFLSALRREERAASQVERDSRARVGGNPPTG